VAEGRGTWQKERLTWQGEVGTISIGGGDRQSMSGGHMSGGERGDVTMGKGQVWENVSGGQVWEVRGGKGGGKRSSSEGGVGGKRFSAGGGGPS
jgi:hypothetical protein